MPSRPRPSSTLAALAATATVVTLVTVTPSWSGPTPAACPTGGTSSPTAAGEPTAGTTACPDPSSTGDPSPTPTQTVAPSLDPVPTVEPTESVGPPPTSPATLREMERSLARLGLPTGAEDGSITSATRRGLCVFRDLTGTWANRTSPSPDLVARIARTTALPPVPRRLRSVRAFVSLTCQAAYITRVHTGRIVRVLPVSTGEDKALHRTRTGVKRVYWRVNRWQASTLFPEPDGRPGLYRPIYFDQGIAFHGVRSKIGARPQSHGCVRTRLRDQDWLWPRLELDDLVYVYGDYWMGSTVSLAGRR